MQEGIRSLYFIRHGRTEWNEKRLLQGSKDSPLTEEGILQAQLLANVFKDIPFVAGYSSPLKRAKKTLELLLNERNVPLYEDAGLAEFDFGSWEGVSIETLRTQADYQMMLKKPELYTGERNFGETNQVVLARGLQAVKNIIEQQKSGAIAIVSHGAFLLLLLHVIAGGNWHEYRHPSNELQRITNLGVSLFEYIPDPNIDFLLRFKQKYTNKSFI